MKDKDKGNNDYIAYTTSSIFVESRSRKQSNKGGQASRDSLDPNDIHASRALLLSENREELCKFEAMLVEQFSDSVLRFCSKS